MGGAVDLRHIISNIIVKQQCLQINAVLNDVVMYCHVLTCVDMQTCACIVLSVGAATVP